MLEKNFSYILLISLPPKEVLQTLNQSMKCFGAVKIVHFYEIVGIIFIARNNL